MQNRNADASYRRAMALAKRARTTADKKASVEVLRLAVAAGHAAAAHGLALCHIHGFGVRKSFKTAVALEKIAARANIADALFNLGYAHEVGKGTTKDTRRALGYYRRGARLGDPNCMEELDRCIFYGIGIKANRKNGLAWIDRADALRTKRRPR